MNILENVVHDVISDTLLNIFGDGGVSFLPWTIRLTILINK